MAAISRRTLLSRAGLAAGVLVGAGLGLTRHVQHKVAVPPPPPPTGLTDALARQQSLLAGYRQVASAPAGLKADVSAHGDALRALLELYPGWRLSQRPSAASSTGSSPGVAIPASVAELASGSTAMLRALTATVQTWPADEPHAVTVLPTLASIAASLSTHVAVLT